MSAAQGVTNEMLKLIPPFREQDERLLICATNSIRALDSAFLRHGRFGYVIPVGPPDPAAREAIWDRYLGAIPHGELDMAAIVQESRLFTPADIEFAACRTAQLAFERGLVCIDWTAAADGRKIFMLRYLQARDLDLPGTPFLAAFSADAAWLTDLRPTPRAPGSSRLRFCWAGISGQPVASPLALLPAPHCHAVRWHQPGRTFPGMAPVIMSAAPSAPAC